LNASDDKLLQKLKSKFTEEDQQLFIESFRMYLNHDQETEYIVDLDDIWEWLGFSRKDPAKRVLHKNFEKEVDYKIIIHQDVINVSSGRPNEQILMNIKTFKKLCLKANTEKADDVHNYYIKME
jgi:phage anti-repressor protein